MQTFLNLIAQRRVWVTFLGIVVFITTSLGIAFDIEIPVLADLLTNFGVAIVALVQAGLAIWSYLAPKVIKKSKKK